jgi:integrase
MPMQRVLDQAQAQEQAQQAIQTRTKHEVYYSNFINSLPAPATKNDYGMTIRDFMRFLGIPEGNYGDLVVGKDKNAIEIDIKSFLVHLRQERGITYGSANHYLSAIKAFYYENCDFEFKWKRIKKHLGEDTGPAKKGKDRGYTLEEIQMMLDNARDPRTKVAVLLMASNGMRVGAVPDLVLGDLTKIPEQGIYEITVYNEYKQQYRTFCSRECTKEIDAYLQYRKNCGEDITKDSHPLIREQFDSRDGFKVRNPKKVKRATISYLINQVLTKHSSLKQKLPYDKKNRRIIGQHQTAMTHAFRKFFTSTVVNEGGMLPDWADLLTGHKMPGVRNSYLIPTTKQLLEGTAEHKEGYLYVEPWLTINSVERERLDKARLEAKIKTQQDIDKRIESLQNQVEYMAQFYDKYKGMRPEYKKIPC